jgi:hypothetical protein
MRRQVVAVIIGVLVAVATLFALFDERISFRDPGVRSKVTQSEQAQTRTESASLPRQPPTISGRTEPPTPPAQQ